eukprot:m.497592 g.497592  ORF g.497592 m.497592 type:complete len:582 (+) comp51858_c0_seq1:100-1845(+)
MEERTTERNRAPPSRLWQYFSGVSEIAAALAAEHEAVVSKYEANLGDTDSEADDNDDGDIEEESEIDEEKARDEPKGKKSRRASKATSEAGGTRRASKASLFGTRNASKASLPDSRRASKASVPGTRRASKAPSEPNSRRASKEPATRRASKATSEADTRRASKTACEPKRKDTIDTEASTEAVKAEATQPEELRERRVWLDLPLEERDSLFHKAVLIDKLRDMQYGPEDWGRSVGRELQQPAHRKYKIGQVAGMDMDFTDSEDDDEFEWEEDAPRDDCHPSEYLEKQPTVHPKAPKPGCVRDVKVIKTKGRYNLSLDPLGSVHVYITAVQKHTRFGNGKDDGPEHKLYPWDRLITVNGTSIVGKPYDDVKKLIAKGGEKIVFTAMYDPPPEKAEDADTKRRRAVSDIVTKMEMGNKVPVAVRRDVNVAAIAAGRRQSRRLSISAEDVSDLERTKAFKATKRMFSLSRLRKPSKGFISAPMPAVLDSRTSLSSIPGSLTHSQYGSTQSLNAVAEAAATSNTPEPAMPRALDDLDKAIASARESFDTELQRRISTQRDSIFEDDEPLSGLLASLDVAGTSES